jgi:hypothetical protein
VGAACLNFSAGLGPLSKLVYTEQWGYTKQEMGENVALGGLLNLVIIAGVTIFANRLNRMRTYQTLIILELLAYAIYYSYVEFVLPDKRPTLFEILLFGELISVFAILTNVAFIPLVYDYVRRNLMGTYIAGSTLVMRLSILATINGVGLFVWGYASLFQPPAGDMTRVAVNRPDISAESVRRVLESSPAMGSTETDGGGDGRLDVRAWQASGILSESGRVFEIRRCNSDSHRLVEERDLLTREISTHRANREEKSSGIALEQKERLAALEEKLKQRSNDLEHQVLNALDVLAFVRGDEILGASVEHAKVGVIPLKKRGSSSFSVGGA